ncbi:bifunctional biotin--[acetyl-CoA-carboxylase] ligase/biotin operon repressor BirA [Agarivorans sp. 1_MG-2023]|uniref:bifunctional biotin--[acetyl-CoA-carboxylase] ligase/biotin operon repressor BirA n=1 Tax=Agarivorans sp. 1_MG-2023 TaxID=3062634 RepID=UPI0026E24999|nr:bifunctional biotin--[acetyl-CoA-carboxylase] ligase/biotin operon repressor BirA [Agarivorans sp. 1_MG-2023]MDO6763506.1 bifunctional biotin--[acetyl-CoA-carboxylase] ligase/biotin operon repressor BirA [Agarivorans sp. 1_MG-2023]
MRENKPYKLIQALANGQFCSGEHLAQLIGVSRTTVASYINKYTQLGLDIYKVKGKGYRLAAPISLLDFERLTLTLPENSPVVIEQVDSTNAWLMKNLNQLSHGQVVLAEFQSAGRGRRGRAWQTPYAGQLCMSLLWRLQDGIEAAMGLSLAVGLAVVEALEQAGYSNLGLKWPNDIYLDGKKLGGVLIELQGHANSEVSLVVGVGVNVRVDEERAKHIDQLFTQLENDPNQILDRSQLACLIVQSLNQMYAVFREQGFSALQERWNRYDVFKNQPVSLRFSENKVLQGLAKGVDQQGQLILDTDEGEQVYMAGEVSLRGQ